MKTIDSFGIADAGALPVPAISKHLWADTPTHVRCTGLIIQAQKRLRSVEPRNEVGMSEKCPKMPFKTLLVVDSLPHYFRNTNSSISEPSCLDKTAFAKADHPIQRRRREAKAGQIMP
jgi:hypothetical protein